MCKQIKKKLEEYREMLKIWLKRPTSTFREVSDIYHKQPILNKAYEESLEMLKRDHVMFNEVCNALLYNFSIREQSIKGKDIVKIISKEDQIINKYEQKVREDILNYLADNSAPDVRSSLVLTSLLIDLERLGDYTKDLAKITLINPVDLRDEGHLSIIRKYYTTIMEMFNLTIMAFEKKDKKKAEEVMEMNKRLRRETDKFLIKINKDKKLRKRDAITYTLFTRYFRRVSAHLENIASSVVSPFPYLGFKTSKH